MIFTETCYSSRLLALMLRNLGFEAIFINGKMSQVYLIWFSDKLVNLFYLLIQLHKCFCFMVQSNLFILFS